MNFSSQFEAFHEQAIMAAGGLSDFGERDYEEPLRCLLRDYDKAPFSEVGIQMKAGDVVGNLTGRLLAQQGFAKDPEFAFAKIEKPLIICGLPRTGTTVLHRLISLDPGTQALQQWLGSSPMPRPPSETWESNPRYQQAHQAMITINQLMPDLWDMHPMTAAEPDECHFATGQSFCVPDRACTATAPEYSTWLHQADAHYLYWRYRKTLGLIAGGNANRWVLKDPHHIWYLPALLDVFPDACIVITHRDPIDAISSTIKGYSQFRLLCEPGVGIDTVARDILCNWGKAVDRGERERANIDPARIFDLHVDDINADPTDSIERVYAYFGLPISPEARIAWRHGVQTAPRGIRKARRFKPEDYGLSTKAIHAGIGAYLDRYRQVEQMKLSMERA